MLGFQKTAHDIKELSIHVHYISLNGWGTAVSGAFSPSSEIICEIVNSVAHGNFTLSQEKVREFQKPLAVSAMSE